MGFLDDIFGGGGGGGFSATQIPTLTGGQGGLLDLITSLLSGQFQGGQLQGITPFQGTRPGEVPFGPLQQQGVGGLLLIFYLTVNTFIVYYNYEDGSGGVGFWLLCLSWPL